MRVDEGCTARHSQHLAGAGLQHHFGTETPSVPDQSRRGPNLVECGGLATDMLLAVRQKVTRPNLVVCGGPAIDMLLAVRQKCVAETNV